ncbi:Rhodanese domain-containing protein [Alicyclobacillus hesperidum URH17-3-68]|uniref:Sulfurtransferase n=1 Tax=Alicyclobacillus hesperidum TaxID=89784 RepID=A0A1H2TAK6_9BACL|nr:sulfurtransferase [Alicyclobacillus hesperidum]EJY55989.1 Rhodanese domain-containing protein [Alicyclobacillus hesperidum URH17-3-68]GLG00897.1 sulfurtransferase [Alicyclobacillus hesperidum subsp. aegles]GLV13825.1 sulfurtransferase [Alicyclobacillus hesperidum]SDW40880.1 thiosulfate sulfurtransferase [Alicyclobacillus hesperidum]
MAKDVLVTTEWVAAHKNDPNVLLVEVDVDTSAYESGHIQGAIAWNWTTQLNDQVRRDILNHEQWAELLSNSGATPETLIVLYGDNNNWFAAFAYWQLKIFGHENVKLMDGGRKKWELEGRELVKEVPSRTKTQYPVPNRDLDTSIRARQIDVLNSLNKGNVALVDVRSPQEFTGEVIAPPGMTETAQRGGHIPGAVNVPWGKAVNEDGTFKSEAELKQLYESVGVTPDKEVIAYCRIGERSSHTWFVLRELLGFQNVKNYDGSWTEWGSMVGVPIER